MISNVNNVKEQRMHSAVKARDANSKNIFHEPMLYAQFLRDNLDIPVLKHVQPEDIEDVSEQFVPLFAPLSAGLSVLSGTIEGLRQ